MNLLKSVLIIALPISLLCSWAHTHFTNGFIAETYYTTEYRDQPHGIKPPTFVHSITISPARGDDLVRIRTTHQSNSAEAALEKLNSSIKCFELAQAHSNIELIEPPFARLADNYWTLVALKTLALTFIITTALHIQQRLTPKQKPRLAN